MTITLHLLEHGAHKLNMYMKAIGRCIITNIGISISLHRKPLIVLWNHCWLLMVIGLLPEVYIQFEILLKSFEKEIEGLYS